MIDLAFGDQVLHRAGHILDRDVGIDPVLIEEVDGVDPQTLERVLGDLADAFRAAVEAARSARTEVETELGGDDGALSERLQRLAHEFLVGERAIDFGSVEERDAALDRRAGQRDHFRPVRGRATVMVHAHAAQADGRDLKAAVSQLAHLHLSTSFARAYGDDAVRAPQGADGTVAGTVRFSALQPPPVTAPRWAGGGPLRHTHLALIQQLTRSTRSCGSHGLSRYHGRTSVDA